MTIKNIFVIGAGTMGNGIAQIAATSGYQVTCMDVQPAALEKAKAPIEAVKGYFFGLYDAVVGHSPCPAGLPPLRRCATGLPARVFAPSSLGKDPRTCGLGEVVSGSVPSGPTREWPSTVPCRGPHSAGAEVGSDGAAALRGRRASRTPRRTSAVGRRVPGHCREREPIRRFPHWPGGSVHYAAMGGRDGARVRMHRGRRELSESEGRHQRLGT